MRTTISLLSFLTLLLSTHALVSESYYNGFIETLGVDARISETGIDCTQTVSFAVYEFRNSALSSSVYLDNLFMAMGDLIDKLKFEVSPSCRTFIGDFEGFMVQYFGDVEDLKQTAEHNLGTYSTQVAEALETASKALEAGDAYSAGKTHAIILRILIGLEKPTLIKEVPVELTQDATPSSNEEVKETITHTEVSPVEATESAETVDTVQMETVVTEEESSEVTQITEDASTLQVETAVTEEEPIEKEKVVIDGDGVEITVDLSSTESVSAPIEETIEEVIEVTQVTEAVAVAVEAIQESTHEVEPQEVTVTIETGVDTVIDSNEESITQEETQGNEVEPVTVVEAEVVDTIEVAEVVSAQETEVETGAALETATQIIEEVLNEIAAEETTPQVETIEIYKDDSIEIVVQQEVPTDEDIIEEIINESLSIDTVPSSSEETTKNNEIPEFDKDDDIEADLTQDVKVVVVQGIPEDIPLDDELEALLEEDEDYDVKVVFTDSGEIDPTAQFDEDINIDIRLTALEEAQRRAREQVNTLTNEKVGASAPVELDAENSSDEYFDEEMYDTYGYGDYDDYLESQRIKKRILSSYEL